MISSCVLFLFVLFRLTVYCAGLGEGRTARVSFVAVSLLGFPSDCTIISMCTQYTYMRSVRMSAPLAFVLSNFLPPVEPFRRRTLSPCVVVISPYPHPFLCCFPNPRWTHLFFLYFHCSWTTFSIGYLLCCMPAYVSISMSTCLYVCLTVLVFVSLANITGPVAEMPMWSWSWCGCHYSQFPQFFPQLLRHSFH